MSKVIAIVLLSIYVALCAVTIVNTAPTCDEVAHHPASGYSFWKTGDFRLNPSNPPFIRELMAIPYLVLRIPIPLDHQSWDALDSPEFGKQFFYYTNANADFLASLARAMIVVLGVCLGLVVFCWARKLYGVSGGIGALLFYCFSPNIIAHSSVATLDIGFTLFFLLALLCFTVFLKQPTLLHAVCLALFLGLANASKYTAVLLYPFLAVYTWLYCVGHRDGKGGVRWGFLVSAFFASVVVVWATYGFECKPFLAHVAQPQEKFAFAQNVLPWANPMTLEKILTHTPLPLTSYITGFFGVLKHADVGHNTFFCGHWSSHGSRWYYLLALAIKTPIPTIALIILYGVKKLKSRKIVFDEFLLVGAVCFLIFVASQSTLQLGLRYILPVYPMLFIFLGGIAASFLKRKQKVGRVVIGLLCLWYMYSGVAITPQALSYFNEFVGGPANGYRYLRDSNIDWGQDIKRLSKVLEDLGAQRVKLYYFGQAVPESYGIIYEDVTAEDFQRPEEGVYYAISVQHIDTFSWVSEHTLQGRVGWSIQIHRGEK